MPLFSLRRGIVSTPFLSAWSTSWVRLPSLSSAKWRLNSKRILSAATLSASGVPLSRSSVMMVCPPFSDRAILARPNTRLPLESSGEQTPPRTTHRTPLARIKISLMVSNCCGVGSYKYELHSSLRTMQTFPLGSAFAKADKCNFSASSV